MATFSLKCLEVARLAFLPRVLHMCRCLIEDAASCCHPSHEDDKTGLVLAHSVRTNVITSIKLCLFNSEHTRTFHSPIERDVLSLLMIVTLIPSILLICSTLFFPPNLLKFKFLILCTKAN